MKASKIAYNIMPFKKYLFYVIRKIYCPKFYAKLNFNGIFKIKFDDVYFKITHYGYYIENDLFWKGIGNGWEGTSIKLWKKLCEKANFIVDIGANTGIYALIAKASNNSANVYAFEPIERTYIKLAENAKINKFNIKCINKAVSNYDGVGVIYDSKVGNIYSVTVNKNLYPTNILYPVTIQTIKLDTFMIEEQLEKIDLIKIDVETHEIEVLEGFQEQIKKFQPTLLIEILTEEVANGVEKILEKYNYLYFNICENVSIKLVTKIKASNSFNYLICKDSVARELHLI